MTGTSSIDIFPSQTTIYQLTASNGVGEVTVTLEIVVTQAGSDCAIVYSSGLISCNDSSDIWYRNLNSNQCEF